MIVQRVPTIATKEFVAGQPGVFGGVSSTIALASGATTGSASLPATSGLTTGTAGEAIAIYAATTTLTVPPLTADALEFVAVSIPLTTFPALYRLASGQLATVLVSFALQLPSSFTGAFPVALPPYASLALAEGAAPLSTAPYTLVGPGFFGGFSLSVSVPFTSPINVAGASTAPLAVWAALIGPVSQ